MIAHLLKKILKKTADYEKPRADMFLPLWLLVMGIILVVGSLCTITYFMFYFNITWIAVCCALLVLGMAAVLCWANQKIYVLDGFTFEYITMFGHKKVYNFYQITSIKVNNDSFTLYLGNEKIHIESCARMSGRLIEKINEALERQK